MKRPTSLPVLVQVAALAVLAVVMSQAVAFGVVVLAPEPRPAGFSIATAADALRGRPAQTSDGRALRRRLTDQPPLPDALPEDDLMAAAIGAGLAQRLDVGADDVRVRVDLPERRGPRAGSMRVLTGPQRSGFAIADPLRTGSAPRPQPALPAAGPSKSNNTAETRELRAQLHVRQLQPAGADTAFVIQRETRGFSILADRLTFAPFTASVRQADGRWATVEAPRDLLSPWQKRVLLALAISMLLLAPLVWFMARRLTRPIRVFADAAERLGADPDAEPLIPSGPSEVRTAIQAFNDMQASLRDHMRRRTQTVAAIAHDLRTPL
ncbi:MAG TPA: HAMP domain-containing protein, partial [Brevundimonas sp.]|nr:HAMP domain-containing protein [Brevundimonas sp.]